MASDRWDLMFMDVDGEPVVVAFVGRAGTGKARSIQKLAAYVDAGEAVAAALADCGRQLDAREPAAQLAG